MNAPRRRVLLKVAAAVAIKVPWAPPARAQGSRPLCLAEPFTPGGSSDIPQQGS